MGTTWLRDLPTWLSAAGLNVSTYSGWESRSRSSGGYEGSVRAIAMHHDASTPQTSVQAACNYAWQNSPDGPIGAIILGRKGEVVVGAAGATNTMGKGGPVPTSRGTIPQDKGNLYMLAIEAMNNGVGETWPQVQLTAYFTMVRTLMDRLGLRSSDVYTHYEYCQPSCPGRKIDPRGPTPSMPDLGGTSGQIIWPTAAIRKRLDAMAPPQPQPPQPPASDWPSKGAAMTTPPASPVLKRGVKHSNVPWLQAVLCSMPVKGGSTPIFNPDWVGYDSQNGGQSVANLFGDATYNALAYWQGANGLAPDGVYDVETANKMYSVRKK